MCGLPLSIPLSVLPSLHPPGHRLTAPLLFCRSGVLRCLTTFPFPKCSIQTRNSLSLQHIPEEEEEKEEEEVMEKNGEEESHSGRSFSFLF